MTDKLKQNRLPNFTPAEESFLLSLANEHVALIESKPTDGHIWEEKRKVWENIDIEFGKKFGFRRGWKNLRKKYDNLKRKLRRLESKEGNVGQMLENVMVDEADTQSTDSVDKDDAFETEPEINHDLNDETVQSCSLDDPNEDSEPIENEDENKWFSSYSQYSAQNKKIKSVFLRPDRRERFSVKEELRSAERHRWDANRNKREAEKHKWEFEKHKLVVEKQKWELKEAKLKAKILQMKLKNFLTGNGSKSPISDMYEDSVQVNPKSHTGTQVYTNAHNNDEAQNLNSIDTFVTNIKVEPALEIIDIGNDSANNFTEDRSSSSRSEKRIRLDAREYVIDGSSCKKLKTIQPAFSDEQLQWEQALKNDMLDTPKSHLLDTIQLVNANISPYVGDDDDDIESDTCNIPNEESMLLETTADDQMRVATNDHGFLTLLSKHKLQHYLPKLKEINIGIDYLQYIQETDIRDICGRDISARLRFRALLEDWRTAHRKSPQLEIDTTKRDIAELKALIKDAQNTFSKAGASEESKGKQNSNYNKVLPAEPFHSVLDFKVFEELIKTTEEAYQNLIAELLTQNISNSVNFLKASWRRIMSDHVAQHFCWTGTQEKPAIRTLSVTKALKEAYQRKFDYCTYDDFQRAIQPFFQHAKTRLQKKQNYEKLKATNTTF
ncbi:uncharacterized protein LOC105218236 isoform X2 [Zeugodacus cucurbitae]|uniref:uncharacterized protein LOC105218236 isoform X2 n=1 Tax=Zeugodacus cucurbitae TaxID=28588 RepID=UPI0023D8EA65|nr:uncharacterized protein LOC105218236 isoform X2 [Zeugodacus cucurbitae]